VDNNILEEFDETAEGSLMDTIPTTEDDGQVDELSTPKEESNEQKAPEKESVPSASFSVDDLDESENDASEIEEAETPEEKDDGRCWYTLQCYSLQEYKVRDRLNLMMQDVLLGKVFRALLPEEETVEIKNNKRVERTTKIYPGYMFVQMLPDQEAWFLIKQIPGVAKIVGDKKAPTAVSSKEIDKILRKVGDKTKKIEVDFELHEMIKVISGPFRGYSGVISEINADRGKLKSLISIFGRETPVELDFDQVEKAIEN
jgi:transcription termination/antitermination protein NusG